MTPADQATAPPPSAPATEPGRLVLLVVGAWTVVGLVLASSYYGTGLASARPYPLWRALGVGFLEAYVWVPITLVVFALVRRFPLEPGQRLRHGAILLIAGVALVVVKMAIFHFPGQAMGLLRRETTYLVALVAYGGQRLVTYGLLVGVAHAVRYARTVRERELSRSQLQTQLVQAQLQMLKMQLHPHFLFNTLHAISTLVHVDPDRAERMIASLSEMLRGTLAQQRAQEVTLREELAALEPYLDIETTRLGERLAVATTVEPGTGDALVPHLLLQPLVENAIRHGISPRRRPGRVEIRATRADGRLELEVADNGAGISASPRPGAIGLANTRARLQQLYGDAHAFTLDSAPEEGTRVRISLPFRVGEPAPAPQG